MSALPHAGIGSSSQAARLIRESNLTVALTGAGISTPSGIPDFRTPSAGMLEQGDYTPTLTGFCQDPQAFYDWVRPLARVVMRARPNAAHLALAEMERRGYLHAVITQNIDLLHSRAGSNKVVEVHGHIRQATCLRCYRRYAAEAILARFVEDGLAPYCTVCGGVLKPDVILFGEQLPVAALAESDTLARRCEVMLVAGSSLEVAPAGELPAVALAAGARLIIVNAEPTAFDREADVVIRADVAEALPAIQAELLMPEPGDA